LHLARALAARRARDEVDVLVVTAGVHEVTGEEALIPERATIRGACLSVGQEYPHIRVRHVDVDLAPAPAGAARAGAALVRELAETHAPPSTAHRHERRWALGHARVPPAPRPAGSVLRRRGTYLITGGLGSIGIIISQYLAQRYAARLVLVGRTPVPPRDRWPAPGDEEAADAADPAATRARSIRAIERMGGEVLYVQADVADERRMHDAIDLAHRRFGPIHGVIHGAGIVGDDHEIGDCDAASCARHFSAKARGATVLASVLAGEPLDFCLLMSSLTSVLGGVGQSAYAASNLFLDAFARARNRTGGLRWLSVNWDVWRVGSARTSHAGASGTLRELGMNAAEAVEILERVLVLVDAGQLIVSTGDLDLRVGQWLDRRSLGLRQTAGAGARTRAPRPSLGTAFLPPRDETERRVAGIWCDAFGVEEIGVDDRFAELGGHSLLAVRIVAELRRVFELDLPVRALFDAPTVGALARRIREAVAAEVAALGEEEAEHLVFGN
jgi:NAD(P)-dependent dehydrogenase (short-subunit alcohol dehydrogenase family)/acyl carrier protein